MHIENNFETKQNHEIPTFRLRLKYTQKVCFKFKFNIKKFQKFQNKFPVFHVQIK